MKTTLKLKLTLSYIFVSFFLILSLFLVSNYFFQKQFQTYIIGKQDIKNEEIRRVIINAYDSDGKPPSFNFLREFGENLLEQNLMLTVYDKKDREIFCITCINADKCDHALKSAEEMMKDAYPNFKGKFIEKKLTIEKTIDNKNTYLGYISIGYYGPFFLNESDHIFLSSFNNTFIIAALLSLIISIVLGIISANRVAKPIKEVIKKTKDISDGDYNNYVKINSTTKEIDELANSVNSLTETLNNEFIIKKQMASDFTHEFLTPLTSIETSLDAMLDGILEPTNDRLENLKKQSKRLSRMVFDINKLVSNSNEEEIVTKSRFDISLLTESIINNCEGEILKKDLKVKFINRQVHIIANQDKINQVILNLLSNAIKYSKQSGEIKISITNNNKEIKISIEDNGVGINKKDLPFIFEYLYRVDKSRDSKTGGRGIGLYIVKSIVSSHNGVIDVISKEKEGTKFIVTLPSK